LTGFIDPGERQATRKHAGRDPMGARPACPASGAGGSCPRRLRSRDRGTPKTMGPESAKAPDQFRISYFQPASSPVTGITAWNDVDCSAAGAETVTSCEPSD